MKTAGEYLTKETDFYLNWELPERNKMIALLKGYANQKLDEAANNAFDYVFSNINAVKAREIQKSILSLKDPIDENS